MLDLSEPAARPEGAPEAPVPTTAASSVVLAGAFGALVAVLGVLRAGDESYWMDESYSAYFVDRPFGGLLHVLWYGDAGMGPYYLGLWSWSHVLGSEAGMRGISVLGGIAAVVALVLFADRRFGRRVAVVAGVLFVTNPFFLRYLTELRTYSWVMAMAVVFVAATVALADVPTLRRAVVVGAAAGLGLAMHFLFVLWVVAVVVVLVVGRRLGRAHLPSLVAAGVVALLVVAPFLHAFVRRPDQFTWIPATSPSVVVTETSRLAGGVLWGVLAAVGLIALVVDVVRRRAATTATLAVLAAGVVGPALFLLVSLGRPIFVARYLSPAAPFLALGAAAGFAALEPVLAGRTRRGALLAAVSLVAVVGFVARGPFSDEERPGDDRAAVEYVLGELGPGDLVAINRSGTPGILRYLGIRPDIDPASLGAGPDTAARPPRRPLREIADQLAAAPRVFVFLWRDQPPGPVLRELAAERDVRVVEFGKSVVWVLD